MNRKNIKIYHVDAFAETPFRGNPAAVCISEDNKNDTNEYANK